MKKLIGIIIWAIALFLVSGFESIKAEGEDVNKENGEVVVLDKDDFVNKVYNYKENPREWVYEGKKPCIVDFYADWCGPCKVMSPILKELATEYKNDIIVYKINVDKNREVARAFGIRSVPTLLFIPAEGIPMVNEGALPKGTLVQQIETFLLQE